MGSDKNYNPLPDFEEGDNIPVGYIGATTMPGKMKFTAGKLSNLTKKKNAIFFFFKFQVQLSLFQWKNMLE